MQQQGRAHSEPARVSAASPDQRAASTSHHPLCAPSPRLTNRVVRAPACRAWNLLSVCAWSLQHRVLGAVHPTRVSASILLKAHISLVAAAREGIWRPAHSTGPLLPFPDGHSVPAAGSCRARAGRPPAGETTWEPSGHGDHPLHLCVHKQVIRCTVGAPRSSSPDLVHSTSTSQDPGTGRTQETHLVGGRG